MNNIIQLLRKNNLKATPQRIAIYSELLKSRSHPTAEMLYNSVKQVYPAISLATVYKTLALLKDYGLIQEISSGEQPSRYDACNFFHPHTICIKCGEVADISFDLSIDELRSKIYNMTGFQSNLEQLYFFGICKNCRKSV